MGASGILFGDPNFEPIRGTLQEWESYTRQGNDSQVEHAALFSANGEPIVGYGGDEHSVAVDKQHITNSQGGILTHIHPNNDFGGTLSMQDVWLFANSDLSELRAVSEQGQVYSIKANNNLDRDKLKKWVNTNKKLMQKNFVSSYKSALKQATTPLKSGPHKGQIKLVNRRTGKVVYRQPMTPEQAARYARQYSVGAFDRMYKKNLSKFGVTYTSTKAGV